MNNIDKELLDKIQSLESMKDSLFTACEVIGVLKFEIDNITKERDALRRNKNYLYRNIADRLKEMAEMRKVIDSLRESNEKTTQKFDLLCFSFTKMRTTAIERYKAIKVLQNMIEKIESENKKLTAENKFLSDKDNEPAFAFLKVVNLLTNSGFAVLHITQNKFAISRDPGKYLFFNNLDELTTYLKGGDDSETDNG